jgi:hypothetical protein
MLSNFLIWRVFPPPRIKYGTGFTGKHARARFPATLLKACGEDLPCTKLAADTKSLPRNSRERQRWPVRRRPGQAPSAQQRRSRFGCWGARPTPMSASGWPARCCACCAAPAWSASRPCCSPERSTGSAPATSPNSDRCSDSTSRSIGSAAASTNSACSPTARPSNGWRAASANVCSIICWRCRCAPCANGKADHSRRSWPTASPGFASCSRMSR